MYFSDSGKTLFSLSLLVHIISAVLYLESKSCLKFCTFSNPPRLSPALRQLDNSSDRVQLLVSVPATYQQIKIHSLSFDIFELVRLFQRGTRLCSPKVSTMSYDSKAWGILAMFFQPLSFLAKFYPHKVNIYSVYFTMNTKTFFCSFVYEYTFHETYDGLRIYFKHLFQTEIT